MTLFARSVGLSTVADEFSRTLVKAGGEPIDLSEEVDDAAARGISPREFEVELAEKFHARLLEVSGKQERLL